MELPSRQGLYDPTNERDACGVGFVAHIKNQKSHAIVEQGLQILKNLEHRGATGAEPATCVAWSQPAPSQPSSLSAAG